MSLVCSQRSMIVVLVLVALVACQMSQVESCRRNRTELARQTIINLLRLHPELLSEVTSNTSTDSATTNTNTNTNGQATNTDTTNANTNSNTDTTNTNTNSNTANTADTDANTAS